MRFGSTIERDGKWVADVPIGNVYKCKKCGKTVVEHLWVGHGWRNHVESYGGVMNGIAGNVHCSVSNCEVNHRNECDGKLEIIRKGSDSFTTKKMQEEIRVLVQKLFNEA